MATTEDVIILKVGTDEAVKSVGDLKNNIKELKKQLDGYKEATGEVDEQGKKVYKTIEGLAIGSDAYKKALEELKINQNALRDAMYATTASMEEVSAAATGTSKSYNSLVHLMASLKEEWRATNDEARRNELGKQIAEINQQLKDMDASVGNFQRNVGNYESGVSGLVAKFDAWGATLKQMPPTLGAAKESIGKVGETMQLVGKQPILGIIGLLAPIIMKITSALQENETAMGAVKKLMESLQPVFDILEKVLEGIAQGISKAVEWFVKLIGESDGIKKIISSVSGVGNAIFQYLLAPVKAAVQAFVGLGNIMKDVFTGKFNKIKEDAKQAWEGIKNAYKEGFSFKNNFDEGKRVGADFISGVKDNKSVANEAGKEIGQEVAKGIEEGLKLADFNKALAEGEKKIDEEREARLQLQQELDAEFEAELEQTNAEIDAFFQEQAEMREQDLKDAEEKNKAKIATMQSVAGATSDILNSLADMYESNEKDQKKNAKKVKALRISAATIDMLQGAVGAFTQASAAYPPPYGQIIGGVSAAAVVAMGIANIAKMKSTDPTGSSGGGSASAVASPSSAVVNPPSVETEIPTIRTATSASEEDRLNRIASPQKVYILQSDIEAAGSQSKAQIEESSF